jgi:hypothetical protein
MQSDLVSSVVPTQFACGRDHTIIAAEGRFFGFGDGKNGQFGQVKGLKHVSHAWTHREHTCYTTVPANERSRSP